MPFVSVKQRSLLAWKHPDVYRAWKAEHGTKIVKKGADHEPERHAARDFRQLRGRLTGISDRALDVHLDLYAQYVDRLNETTQRDGEMAALYRVPIAELDLDIEGRLASALDRLHQSLLERGIEFFPDFYLGAWFATAPGGIAISLPWWLADDLVWRDVNDRTAHVTEQELDRVIRHETGHAIDNSFRLHERRAWRDFFGDPAAPARDAQPDPIGNEFVRYLGAGSHQAQQQPLEDWAETFAAWLDQPDWQLRYTGKAAEKILYVDRLNREGALAGVTPDVTPGPRQPYTELGGTVGQFVGRGPGAPSADDPELLATPVRQLDLEPAGALHDAIAHVRAELLDRGITALPMLYLGDPDFWTVDRHFAVNVPWFLATAQLWRLANQSEPTEYSVDDVRRCLRHEIGHALGYGFRLYEDPEWRDLFGDFDAPYRQDFVADPTSTDYVEYLKDVPEHYAQKHPDEDWAETFATWLDPSSNWQDRYADWPVALAKLRYADKVGTSVLLGDPTVTSPGAISPYRRAVRGTVAHALHLQAPPQRAVHLGNAIRYHESYFEALGGPGGQPGPEMAALCEEAFGSVDEWRRDVRMLAVEVSSGWILTVWDPKADRLRNVAVDQHGDGPAGCPILLALDCWEHASMIDYAEAPYVAIGAWFHNLDWQVVEDRIAALPAADEAAPAPDGEVDEDAKYAGGPGGIWKEALHPRAAGGRFGEKPKEEKPAKPEATGPAEGFKLRGKSVAEHFRQGPDHGDLHEQFAARWVHTNGREDLHKLTALGDLLAGRPDPSKGELGKALYQEDGKKLSEFAHEYYQATQASLKAVGMTGTVKLYRGVGQHQGTAIQATNGPGQKINVGVDPLSSWTTSKEQASEHFAKGTHGVVVEADVPVSQIFAHHKVDEAFREPAYEQEKEVILHVPEGKIHAKIVDDPDNTSHWRSAHTIGPHADDHAVLVERNLDTRNGKFTVKTWIQPDQVKKGDNVVGAPSMEMLDKLGHEPVGRPWIEHKHGMADQTVYSPHNYNQVTNELTPERKKLHDEIIDKALKVEDPRHPDEQPQVLLTMGAPGSGKGQILTEWNTTRAVKIDADEIKHAIPEYQEAVAAYAKDAAFVAHEESSQIAKTILDRAIEQRQHIAFDSTGKNGPKFAETIKRFKDAGYHVTLLMADKDAELGAAHAQARAERSGRHVPDEILKDAYAAMPKNFNLVARLADDAVLYDAPNKRSVWEKHGKEEQVIDAKYLEAAGFKTGESK